MAKPSGRVNHDKLMSLVATKVKDKRVLKLIRKYLESGIMLNEVKKGKARNFIHRKPVERFKAKVREITSRSNGKSMNWRKEKLNHLITGWVNYFRIAKHGNLQIRGRATGEYPIAIFCPHP